MLILHFRETFQATKIVSTALWWSKMHNNILRHVAVQGPRWHLNLQFARLTESSAFHRSDLSRIPYIQFVCASCHSGNIYV